MSIVTRIKNLSESFARSSASKPSSGVLMHSSRHEPVEEALERAAQSYEAPESRRGRPAEAPDAGGGRASYHEYEFTQGRSQS